MASNDTAAGQKQSGGESAAKDTPVFPLFDLKKRKKILA